MVLLEADLLTQMNKFVEHYVLITREDSGKKASAVKAIEQLGSRMKQLYPQHRHGYQILALLYSLTGDLDRSLAEFILAHRQNPEDEILLFNLAQAHHDAGDIQAAMQAWRRVIELDGQYSTQAQALLEAYPDQE
jgi:tetratricopeptide (TPR) repeat protein